MTTDATSQRESWTQRRAVKAVLVALVVMALLCAAVYALGASSRRSFTIRGVAPAVLLRPGDVAPIDLILTNPHDTTLRIGKLAVSVDSVLAPEADADHPCTSDDFAVVQYSGENGVELPASSTRSLSSLGIPSAQWPQVTMPNRPVNQDGCKNASLKLSFTGVVASGDI